MCTLQRFGVDNRHGSRTWVESDGYEDKRLPLNEWKDIELYMVKHPENRKCQTLLMKIKHRPNKGKGNFTSPVFTYTERNDNLGLCAIQDISKGYLAPHLHTEPQTQHPIHFKEEAQEVPAFHHALKDAEGKWITHSTGALQDKKVQEDEEPGSLYKYGKGLLQTQVRFSVGHTIHAMKDY